MLRFGTLLFALGIHRLAAQQADGKRSAPVGTNLGDTGFLETYSPGYMPLQQNASDPKSWVDAFVKEYAAPYMHCVRASKRASKRYSDIPERARDCQTKAQLETWRAANREQIQDSVPSEYRAFAHGSVDREYEDNCARVEAEESEGRATKERAAEKDTTRPHAHNEGRNPAVSFASEPAADSDDGDAGDAYLRRFANRYVDEYAGGYVPVPLPEHAADWHAWRHAFVDRYAGPYKRYVEGSIDVAKKHQGVPERATDCNTVEELRRWRRAQLGVVDAYVPMEERPFVAGAVEQAYASNRARLQEEAERKASEGSEAERQQKDSHVREEPKEASPKDESGHDVALALDAPAALNLQAQERPLSRGEGRGDVQVGARWRDHFLKTYASSYMPLPQNASDPTSWRDAFVKEYAAPYMHYVKAEERASKRHKDVPERARDCHTRAQLESWRAANREQIQDSIPTEYRAFADGSVDREYEDARARIEAEESKARASRAEVRGKDAKQPHDHDGEGLAFGLASDLAAASDDREAGDAYLRRFANRYVDEYAGGYVPTPLPEHAADWQAWRNAFVDRYAGPYKRYVEGSMDVARQDQGVPERATDCNTVEELHRWRRAQFAVVDTYVPREERPFVAGAVEQAYARNKARLQEEAEKESSKGSEAKGKQEDSHAREDPKEASPKGEPSQDGALALDVPVAVALQAREKPLRREDDRHAKVGEQWRDRVLKTYASSYMPLPQNANDPASWRDAFVKEYAGPYMHYVKAEERASKRHRDIPERATDCHTKAQLEAWRAANHEQIQDSVPSEYRPFADGSVDREYEDNRARIEAEESKVRESKAEVRGKDAKQPHDYDGESLAVGFASDPAAASDDRDAGDAYLRRFADRYVDEYAGDYVPVPLPDHAGDWQAWRDAFVDRYAAPYKRYVEGSVDMARQHQGVPERATDCNTVEELRRWRRAQLEVVDTYVPMEERPFVAGAVEQAYTRNKARLQEWREAQEEADARREQGESGSEPREGEEHQRDADADDAGWTRSKGESEKIGARAEARGHAADVGEVALQLAAGPGFTSPLVAAVAAAWAGAVVGGLIAAAGNGSGRHGLSAQAASGLDQGLLQHEAPLAAV